MINKLLGLASVLVMSGCLLTSCGGGSNTDQAGDNTSNVEGDETSKEVTIASKDTYVDKVYDGKAYPDLENSDIVYPDYCKKKLEVVFQ